MPRYSKEVKSIGEANQSTMLKYDDFKSWEKKHLKCKDRLSEYEKAFNYIHKGSEDEQEASGLRSADENEDLSSL